MSGGLRSRLGWEGLVAGVAVAMVAGSSGVATASEDLGGCIYYAPEEGGGPTRCHNWMTENTDLSERDFTGADLSNARFHRTNLSGTNFTNADLSGVEATLTQMSPETQLRGAIVDNKTYLQGLVRYQEVSAVSAMGDKHYFIVGGANPGFPTRYRPPAIAQGVSIDECTSSRAVTVSQTINGQQVDVKALPPGRYVLACTFVTADRPNGRGNALFPVQVSDKLPGGRR